MVFVIGTSTYNEAKAYRPRKHPIEQLYFYFLNGFFSYYTNY